MARWGRPYRRWRGSHPSPLRSVGCALGVGLWVGQVNFESIGSITSVVWQIATRCLILGVGFRGQAIQWRHGRDRGPKRRCHGNQFWNYISCKWPRTRDNNMGISYKGWFVFNQPLRLLVWTVIAFIVTAVPLWLLHMYGISLCLTIAITTTLAYCRSADFELQTSHNYSANIRMCFDVKSAMVTNLLSICRSIKRWGSCMSSECMFVTSWWCELYQYRAVLAFSCTVKRVYQRDMRACVV